jgi:GNAT superfamily N-acetyltransferase
MSLAAPLRIRTAQASDVDLLVSFIQELAREENFPGPVLVTRDHLLESLFGERPTAEAVLGFSSDTPVAFAVFYETFSTITGRRCLHLDDLLVTPSYQGHGYGKAMMRHLAQIALDRHYARFEWRALRYNAQALRFYEAIGARQMQDLVMYRMEEKEMQQLLQK